jgi:hypothetical protein
MAKRKPKRTRTKRTKAASKGARKLHTLHEDYPWEINYADHDARKDSPLYVKSRALLKQITRSTVTPKTPWFFGAGDGADGDGWEDHHGGGLWVHDGQGWFFLKNYAGMEWASQFCADPKKIDQLRQNAARLYQSLFYDNTKAEIAKLDPIYPFDRILKTPITTADQVADWTDSIFNASVSLPKLRHTGTSPKGHGVHHYPTPVYDIELFKHDDFVLWVLDAQRQPAAVLPAHRRGAAKDTPNYGKTVVAYATPGTKLHREMAVAHAKRRVLVAPPDHPLTKQAFRYQ